MEILGDQSEASPWVEILGDQSEASPRVEILGQIRRDARRSVPSPD